jgi:hypothetical protein
MIQDQEGLVAARDRLADLLTMRKKIESDLKLNHRQRASELAGVRGIIEEIEHEIRQYHLAQLQERLNQLQVRAVTAPPAEMPELVSQVIAAVQELTEALQPAT